MALCRRCTALKNPSAGSRTPANPPLPHPAQEEHPSLLDSFAELEAAAAGKLVTIFLDYDGTLTPIVNNPDAAFMSEHMREAVRLVAALFPTAIISGRGREKVQQFVQLHELFYAGSHGMDIAGPKVCADGAALSDADFTFQPAAHFEPLMRQVSGELGDAVGAIAGSSVENNKFCVSVHFRNCAPESYGAVVAAVEEVTGRHEALHITRGRKVLEVRPQVDWNKGTALLHLLKMLGVTGSEVFCLYIGDDRTDEDAFTVLKEGGMGAGVLVSTRSKPTAGRWTLRDPTEVAALLNRLVAWGRTEANEWHGKGRCNGWAMASGQCTAGEGARAAVNEGSTAAMAAFAAQPGGGGAAAAGGGGPESAADRLTNRGAVP